MIWYVVKVRAVGRRQLWVSYGPPFGSEVQAEGYVKQMNQAAGGTTVEYRIEEEEGGNETYLSL